MNVSATVAVTDTTNLSDREDKACIANFLDGDRIGFDRLVLKYRDQIVALCVRYTGDFHDGEDVAQDVFVRVYRNLGKFRGDSLFSTWLYRIAVNLCRNRHRSWWQRLWRSRVRIDSPPEDTERGPTEIGDTSMSPDTDLERSRRAAMVHRALGEIDEKYRELVLLRDFQDKSYEEIGEITGLALGTVKSRLARARQAMRKKLEVLLHE